MGINIVFTFEMIDKPGWACYNRNPNREMERKKERIS